jgi:TetR/AcrR family transcriptional regulator, regulator of biofilm formation and stress response
LDAAVDLFVEGGTRAVTHRAVAKAAGLPPATPTYYFDTIEDLMREAAQRYVANVIESLEGFSTLDAPLSAMSNLDAVTSTISHIYASRGRATVTRDLAVFIQCQSDPLLRPYAKEAIDALEQKMADQLVHFKVERAHDVATMLVAAILGSALRRTAAIHDDAAEARWLAESVRWTVAASLFDDATIAKTLHS